MKSNRNKDAAFRSLFINVLLICSIAACSTASALSQGPAEAPKAPTSSGDRPADDPNERIKALEAQLAEMRAEMDEIKALLLGRSPEKKLQNTTAAANSASTEIKAAAPAATDKAAAPQVKKDLGVDVGSARLTPYGTIYFNAYGNSGGTNNADVPLWAATSGSGNAGASLRQTRLGLKLEGAKVGNARLAAVLEADFFGGFPGVGIGENFGIVRIRLANARLDWEKTSLTIGQDWMPFAPLNPTSLAAAAIPQMAAAGNNWARIPQAKVEHRFTPHLALQAAILAPQTGDSTTNPAFFLQPNSGSSSRIPFLQSRLAYSGTGWLASKKPASIGGSVHYGRSTVFTGTTNVRYDVDSWGVAADWNLPVTDVFAITGEAFAGQDLGGFQAGVFQGLNVDFARVQGDAATAEGVQGIQTRGGWVQLAITPKMKGNKLGFYGTFGIDDPVDTDLTSVSRRDWRQRNMAFAGEVIYKFTPQFQIGFEARRFTTLYLFSRKQTANHLNLGVAYTF